MQPNQNRDFLNDFIKEVLTAELNQIEQVAGKPAKDALQSSIVKMGTV